MIISRTPLRVSFFGGGSDLPAYYREFGGEVLSATIDKAVYVTVTRKFDQNIRVSYSRTEEVSAVDQIEHPLVRESLMELGIEGGVEITSVADIPAHGTGLGSSSAFTVGVLNALHAFQGSHCTAEQLARECCQIELERCGEPIGLQDQYAVAYGGLNHITFDRDDTVKVEKVVSSRDVMNELESQLMFFYTGITRSASELLEAQSQSLQSGASTVTDTAQLVALAASAFDDIKSGDISRFGDMLDESWLIKRSIVNGITNDVIDEAYAVAKAAGAKGGKLLGAGGGGFLMLFVPKSHQADVRQALSNLREVPLRFDPQGSQIIFVY